MGPLVLGLEFHHRHGHTQKTPIFEPHPVLAPDAQGGPGHGLAAFGEQAIHQVAIGAREGLLHPAPEGGRLPLEPQQLPQQQVAFFLQKGNGLYGQKMLGLDL